MARGVYKDVTSHDIVKYGLIPELVGRLPMIVALSNLDEDALVRIIREPKNAMYKQYCKLFSLDGVELEFEENAFREIAKLAIAKEIGARGVRSIMEGIMLDAMYDIPSREDVAKIVITGAYVRGESPLTVITKSN